MINIANRATLAGVQTVPTQRKPTHVQVRPSGRVATVEFLMDVKGFSGAYSCGWRVGVVERLATPVAPGPLCL